MQRKVVRVETHNSTKCREKCQLSTQLQLRPLLRRYRNGTTRTKSLLRLDRIATPINTQASQHFNMEKQEVHWPPFLTEYIWAVKYFWGKENQVLFKGMAPDHTQKHIWAAQTGFNGLFF